MHPQHRAKLASLLTDTDFIFDLRAARPAITDLDYKLAAGWELCINFIINMAEEEQPERQARLRTVDTSALK